MGKKLSTFNVDNFLTVCGYFVKIEEQIHKNVDNVDKFYMHKLRVDMYLNNIF